MKNPLLVKFETKSARVKGISFHPRRPWLITSLHDGTIQLWDYRLGTLIDKYSDHVGPVRGVHFHATQPLFVTGGDDNTVRVWDYHQKKCLFTLNGHLDYVRTVQFHHELPWIISASDDQTVRIWNWLSRSPVHVLSGHGHYVMSARFHPTQNLIISASLDGTARIWDFTGLISQRGSSRSSSALGLGIEFSLSPFAKGKASAGAAGHNGNANLIDSNTDVFGNVDVVVKHILEAHTRGVNWAQFHPILPLVVTASDDRDVKVWRMTDAKCWVVDTLHGHTSHVSSVIFHNKKDFIISNSEDKTLRIWDVSKSQPPVVVRRENDRFWSLEAHPTQSLIAAGHDSGLMVFKLNKERPAFCVVAGLAASTSTTSPTSSLKAFFYKDGFVYQIDLDGPTPQLYCLFGTKKKLLHAALGANSNVAQTLQVNPFDRSNFTTLTTSPDGKYALSTISRQDSAQKGAEAVAKMFEGTGKQAAFVSSTRFAVLEGKNVVLRGVADNEAKRKITIPQAVVTGLYQSPSLGTLLLKIVKGGVNNGSTSPTSPTAGTPNSTSAPASGSTTTSPPETWFVLYDINSLRPLHEVLLPPRVSVKLVRWSEDGKYLALASKTSLVLLSSSLELQCHVTEPRSKIKSLAWDPSGVCLYTTSSHLKFCLRSGDRGYLRTVEVPFYLLSVKDGVLSCIDRSHRFGQIRVNPVEYVFKMALIEGRAKLVASLLQTKSLIGQSLVAFVCEKGYPEIALHFVSDPRAKFALALRCGRFTVAAEVLSLLSQSQEGNDATNTLNSTTASLPPAVISSLWRQLGTEAERTGSFDVAEQCWLRLRDFHRLTLLYTLTGNEVKLSKMAEIALRRSDASGAFQASIFTGDISTQAKALHAVGLSRLAYISALIHGDNDSATSLAADINATSSTSLPSIDDVQSQLLPLWCVDLPPGEDFATVYSTACDNAAAQGLPPPTLIPVATLPAPVVNPIQNWIGCGTGDIAGVEVNTEHDTQPHVQKRWPLLRLRRGFDFSADAGASEADAVALLRAEQEREKEKERALGLDGDDAYVPGTGVSTNTDVDLGDWGTTSSSSIKSSTTSDSSSTLVASTAAATSASGPTSPAGGDFDFDLDLDLGEGEGEVVTGEGDEFYDPSITSSSVAAVAATSTLLNPLPFEGTASTDPALALVAREEASSTRSIPAAVRCGAFDQAFLLLSALGIGYFTPYRSDFLRVAALGGIHGIRTSRTTASTSGTSGTSGTCGAVYSRRILPLAPMGLPMGSFPGNIVTGDPTLDTEIGVVAPLAASPITLPALATLATTAKAQVTAGNTTTALTLFRRILLLLPLVPAISTDDAVITMVGQAAATTQGEALTAAANALLLTASTYVSILSLDLARAAETQEVRKVELSLYAATVSAMATTSGTGSVVPVVDPAHQLLYLWLAMKFAYGIKNIRTVMFVCRRIVEIATTYPDAVAQVADKVSIDTARKLLRKCETTPGGAIDSTTGIAYEPAAPAGILTVCTRSHKALNTNLNALAQDRHVTRCAYCKAAFDPQFSGSICDVCEVGRIGGTATTGLKM